MLSSTRSLSLVLLAAATLASAARAQEPTRQSLKDAWVATSQQLLEVDYKLPVDLRNSWRAGAPMPVKFTASRQAGAPAATVRELRAYASFDDGLNWVPVKSVVPPGGKAGGFVSLRVVATDADGSTVDQTVLRAYRLRA